MCDVGIRATSADTTAAKVAIRSVPSRERVRRLQRRMPNPKNRLRDVEDLVAERLETSSDQQLAQLIWQSFISPPVSAFPEASRDGSPVLEPMDEVKLADTIKPEDATTVADHVAAGATEQDNWGRIFEVQNSFANMQLNLLKSHDTEKRRRQGIELRNQIENNAKRSQRIRAQKLDDAKRLQEQIDHEQLQTELLYQATLKSRRTARTDMLSMREQRRVEQESRRRAERRHDQEFLEDLGRKDQAQELIRQRKRADQKAINARLAQQNQQFRAEKLVQKQKEKLEDVDRMRALLEKEAVLKQKELVKEQERQARLTFSENLVRINDIRERDRMEGEMKIIEIYQQRKQIEEERRENETKNRRLLLQQQCYEENKRAVAEKHQLQLQEALEKIKQRRLQEDEEMQYQCQLRDQQAEQRRRQTQSRSALQEQMMQKKLASETMSDVERAINRSYLEAYQRDLVGDNMLLPLPINRIRLSRSAMAAPLTDATPNEDVLPLLLLSNERRDQNITITDDKHEMGSSDSTLNHMEPGDFSNLITAPRTTVPFAVDDDPNTVAEFYNNYSKLYRPAQRGVFRQSVLDVLNEARMNAISLRPLQQSRGQKRI